MFPGVVPEPNSMVKLGVDVENSTTDAYSGYVPEGQIWGFSMMHESGTGGAPKYGTKRVLLIHLRQMLTLSL